MTTHELNTIGFRQDNTEGYTDDELDGFNIGLELCVADIEPFTDEWYKAADWFADHVARR